MLVGANGTGKSTLFDVFSFLKDALAMNVGKAVSKRGGFKELASRGFAHEPIELTLQFRLEITGKERLVTYQLRVEPDMMGRAVVAREVLRYKRGPHGKPFHFLDFALGQGYAITNEEDFSKKDEDLTREVQALDAPCGCAQWACSHTARHSPALQSSVSTLQMALVRWIRRCSLS